jgi:hypothetical protein
MSACLTVIKLATKKSADFVGWVEHRETELIQVGWVEHCETQPTTPYNLID